MSKSIRIPLLNDNNDGNEQSTIEISESLVSMHLSYNKLFAIKVKDNASKGSFLLSEDLLVLTKLSHQPRNGDLVACEYDDQMRFGHFIKRKGQYILQPTKSLPDAGEIVLPSHFKVLGEIILMIRNNVSDISPDGEMSSELNHQFQAFHNSTEALKRKNRQVKTSQIIITVFASIVVIWFFLNINWPIWTGFQQKTLWDWLELLVIPLLVSFGLFKLNQNQRSNEQKKIEEAVRESSLEQYIDKITELLLDSRRGLSNKNSEECQIARTRTITILRSLDGHRKGIVIKFLHESALIQGDDNDVKVQLVASDLSYANLYASDLIEINLNGTNLYFANLEKSNLSRSLLKDSFLYGANLSNANMTDSDLSNANLENANLTEADLTRANLKGAKITSKQLQSAKSVNGAILPKGLSADAK